MFDVKWLRSEAAHGLGGQSVCLGSTKSWV